MPDKPQPEDGPDQKLNLGPMRGGMKPNLSDGVIKWTSHSKALYIFYTCS